MDSDHKVLLNEQDPTILVSNEIVAELKSRFDQKKFWECRLRFFNNQLISCSFIYVFALIIISNIIYQSFTMSLWNPIERHQTRHVTFPLLVSALPLINIRLNFPPDLSQYFWVLKLLIIPYVYQIQTFLFGHRDIFFAFLQPVQSLHF